MADRPGTLRDAELKAFLAATRHLITNATVPTPHGQALLATPPDGLPAHIDSRTLAAAIVTFSELGDYQRARELARFLLGVQNPTGAWVGAYDPSGAELAGGADEDVTALVLWALMTYVRSSGDSAFSELARDRIEEAARYTRARTLNPYLYLVEPANPHHAPAAASGYELWTNCAHAAAFALCHRVYGGERFRRLALLIRRAIGLLMTHEGRFLRRLDPSGLPDPRPDIALIAPDYFALWAPTERMVMNSADLIERTLWNVEFGGYIRYLPFSAIERTELLGPSPRYSAWMARYHFELGNKDRAEAVMRWLFDQAVGGQLAEVLVLGATARRFLPELRRQLANGARTGLPDFKRQRLLLNLDRVEEQAAQTEVIPCGAPSIWAHLETLRALRRGGYLDTWQLDSAPARRGD